MCKKYLRFALPVTHFTSAQDNIYMTSVDTGWINDENPLVRAQAKAKAQNFQTPIDEVD